MPDRIIRASILMSDRVNSVSWGAEVFYRRLMSVADDYGRYDGRLSVLRSQLFGLKLDKVSESDVSKWIRECEEAGLVGSYLIDGRPYIEIYRFQQRTRAQESKWPAPPSPADNGGQVPAERGHARTYSYSKSETYSKSDSHRAPSGDDAGCVDPLVKEVAVRERNPLFDALADAEGSKPEQLTKPAARAIGVALAQIKKACPELTVAEIKRRAENYRASMPGATLTATALAKHWGRMDEPVLHFKIAGGRPELGGAMAR